MCDYRPLSLFVVFVSRFSLILVSFFNLFGKNQEPKPALVFFTNMFGMFMFVLLAGLVGSET